MLNIKQRGWGESEPAKVFLQGFLTGFATVVFHL